MFSLSIVSKLFYDVYFQTKCTKGVDPGYKVSKGMDIKDFVEIVILRYDH